MAQISILNSELFGLFSMYMGWVHSHRPSLFAIRLRVDSVTPVVNIEEKISSTPSVRISMVPAIDQIIEFPVPVSHCVNMATLILPPYPAGDTLSPSSLPPISSSHGLASGGSVPLMYGPDVIGGRSGYVDADGDPLVAVASFLMHTGGVDQINITMSEFEEALDNVSSKLPLNGFDARNNYSLQSIAGAGAGSKKGLGPIKAPVARGVAPAVTLNATFPEGFWPSGEIAGGTDGLAAVMLPKTIRGPPK